MNSVRNEARITGNLTADPVLRSTGTGRSVCNFVVVTDEMRRDPEGDGYLQHAEYHHCVGWGPQGEKLHKRLRKGDLVLVSGPLRTRSNKTEAATYYNTTIEVGSWSLLHRPQQAFAPAEEGSASA